MCKAASNGILTPLGNSVYSGSSLWERVAVVQRSTEKFSDGHIEMVKGSEETGA